MSPLKIELEIEGQWSQIGQIEAGDPDGSVSDNRADGSRDIYLFGVNSRTNQGYIRESRGGVDIADAKGRLINSLGLTTIASLDLNENYELEVCTDRNKDVKSKLRFIYFGD